MTAAPPIAVTDEGDRRHMAGALAMARRGVGTTAPNPSVGAVLVDPATGAIIARGWTQPGGRPHAETEALRRAGTRARGATLYVTLEPCSHYGKTPPCADAVIAAGVARVVVAQTDPDSRVSGRGIQRLREAGIAVTTGVLEAEAKAVTIGHITRQLLGRPFVQVKLAVSADGRIAPGDGRPVWVTGEASRARGHLLRAEADAIMVGVGTVLADDPRLDCRLPGLSHRSPDRVVVDTHGRTAAQANVLAKSANGARVFIATTLDEASARATAAHASGAIVLWRMGRVDARGHGMVDLQRLLEVLAANGITRLLVEGGPSIVASMLAHDLADEVTLFRSATAIAPDGTEPLGADGLGRFDDATRWLAADTVALEQDTLTIYRRRR
jgi:diaminohydroxyphosphoribosylaminopyrimidine deaminase/5-amino-6-(5-phosphoribosylamino)uracil reductase